MKGAGTLGGAKHGAGAKTEGKGEVGPAGGAASSTDDAAGSAFHVGLILQSEFKCRVPSFVFRKPFHLVRDMLSYLCMA